jgi:hypothetical protein
MGRQLVGGLCSFLVSVAVDEVPPTDPDAAVAAGDGVHGELLPPSAQDYKGSRHGVSVPHRAGFGGGEPLGCAAAQGGSLSGHVPAPAIRSPGPVVR